MDNRNGSSRISRRSLLGAIGAGGSLTLAGCLDLIHESEAELINDGPWVDLELIADGFVYPTDMVEMPDGSGRLLVTDQVGIVYSVDKDDGTVEEVADLTDRVVGVPEEEFSERGLLGIACHPQFDTNGRVFIRYSGARLHDDPGDGWHTEVLSEFHFEEDTIDETSEKEILRIPQPHIIHQGGSVLFGPDGYLYHTTGDGGGVHEDFDPNWYEKNPGMGAHSQTTTDNLLGGVLRIDVDVDVDEDQFVQPEDRYAIPEDNPLVDMEGHRDEYYAWGFRNPWGASFDGDDLYVADVGQVRFEIINRVQKGGNYGWNIREGTHCYDHDDARNPPAECPGETPEDVRGGEPLLDPLIEYPQFEPDGPVHSGEFDTDKQWGSAVIGGHVHRGSIDTLEGAYIFGDWSAEPHGDPLGQLFMARPRDELNDVHWYFEDLDLWGIERLRIEDNDVAADSRLQRYVASMGMDLDGETYALVTETPNLAGETGEIRKLVPPE